MKHPALILLVLVLSTTSAAGYTLVLREVGGQFVPLRWPESSMPVHFSIHEGTGPDLANVTDDSDPMGALQRALEMWPSVSSIRFTTGTTTVASAGNDGVNLLSFANTPENRRLFETVGGATALTMFFFEGTQLREADLVFNPDEQFTTTIDTQAELDASGLYDVEGHAAHELGHAIGVDHSGVVASAMWVVASLAQREPVADDLAGARILYPVDDDYGSIQGTVRVDGIPAFGAHVVAVSSEGLVVGSLTLPDGTYAIRNLPPDSYTVYVEPLDGPHGSFPTGDCVIFGNMSGTGVYGGAVLTTNFTTSFLGGNTNPTKFRVIPGGISVADFALPSGPVRLNPTLLGTAVRDGDSFDFRLAAVPVVLAPGSEQWVVVAGPSLDEVDGSGISVLGRSIRVDSESLEVLEVTCNGNLFPMLVFRLAVAPAAKSGGRTLVLASDEGIATLTGAFRVRATGTLTVCTGDCDGGGEVSVEELVRGVAIALGEMSVSECPDFDIDWDDQVTVDELVQAVNFALSGCPVPLN